MNQKAVMTPVIWTPLPLANDDERPKELLRTTLGQLCEIAGIPLRVTGGIYHEIVLHEGEEHFYTSKSYYIGTQSPEDQDCYIPPCTTGTILRAMAFQILEVLAHGFHDYAARETICNHQLFRVGAKRGRPRLGVKALSAKERMQKMREKRKQDSLRDLEKLKLTEE